MLEFDDIDKRLLEYRSWLNPQQRQANSTTKKLSSDVSDKVREEVLMPYQIRTIAFLLGCGELYESQIYNQSGNPTGLPRERYEKIERKLSPDRIDTTPFIRARRLTQNTVAFPRRKVEEAFSQLSEEGFLEYTVQRFDYALTQI